MSASLRPVRAADADALFPLLSGSTVTDTILWDGPSSLGDYRARLAEREVATAAGALHMFTIALAGAPIGSLDVRPDEDQPWRGDIGFWIGVPHQGRGHGRAAVWQAVRYAFSTLGLAKLEASVFVGNEPSRRVLERVGFRHEGTLRRYRRKRGAFLDAWIFGLVPGEERAP